MTSLKHAKREASRIVFELRPIVQRIEIAGSLRRRTSFIHDIDLVIIPTQNSRGQYEPTQIMVAMYQMAGVRKGNKQGPKQQRWMAATIGIPIELYFTEPRGWGVALAIRTGPASYSKKIVTPRHHGGLLQSDMRVKDGLLWQGEPEMTLSLNPQPTGEYENWKVVPTPEEQEFLKFAGGWKHPKDRE